MIKLHNLTKTYRTTDVETTALDSVNIEINKGEFVAIMGPSGCGKSTLLNIIGMLDNPTSGAYLFGEEDVAAYSEARLSKMRKALIGFIFQSFNLLDELTVFENVELALLYHDIPTRIRKSRVERVLEQTGTIHRRNHRPNQLSGGQQQRVAFARAVVADAPLILADEPTGNLDSANGEEVMGMLRELNSNGTTIIMVTHSLSDAQNARRIINLFDGHVVTEHRRVA